MLIVSVALAAVLFAVSLSGHGGAHRSVLAESVVAAADSSKPGDPEYIGSGKCRLCHLEIYKSWESTRHAHAMSSLASDHNNDSTCVRCHITGYDGSGARLDNVGCEACHGPGSQYRKMRIMKSRDMAVQHGLITQTEAVCTRCHNVDSPTFKGFDYNTVDLEKVHLVPSAID